MIPSNITRDHLIQAMEEIDKTGVPEDRASTKFYVGHNGKHYPPKYLISIANKYANGKVLDPGAFSGRDETNPFLSERGFEVILIPESEKPFDDRLKVYLENVYPNVKFDKVKRSWLKFRDSSTVVYVNGSKLHEANNEGWYDLELKIYNELMTESPEGPPRYYALILGSPDTTFVLPKKKVRDIFYGQPTVQSSPDVKKDPRWMFTIFQKGESYILRLNRSGAIENKVQSYLNNWKQIQDFASMPPEQTANIIEEPINTKNDTALLTFADLKLFLLQKMKPRANYQPVMIKTLLESGGRCTKDQIAKRLKEFNPEENSEKDFKSVPVYSVLEDHHVVRRKEEDDSYILNTVTLSSEQVLQLTLLCNWLIPEHPLQLNELAGLFDKDRNFFAEDRPSAEEIENQRRQFVSEFSEQKIPTMELDEYVMGKGNRTTFCYRLEITLKWLGSIRGSYADKYGIFYNEKRGKYAYDEKNYHSAEEAFSSVKKQLLAILAAGKTFQADKNWKALSDALEAAASDIQSQVKSKILGVYFPNDFLYIIAHV
jgi:hypothetical protein